ncbi:response regulator [Thalassotalea sp. LPB0316]|uniref:HD domain-containing phosphohydrolase n=1 Tax=Thalassotalea sp. LPB0316 TaxID=2769490 RepID=UPI001866D43B|nr:HD domain-containing phosphohydrolase [Thalassotalea sp. LPB0316]QOL25426.1 response regulator [Thalassotalea sp. LPB0316]
MLPSIIVVDDEVEIINALKRTLNGKYNVRGFTDPLKAIEQFKLHPSHIFISDMRMPKMTGAELLITIAKLHEPTKRVILTGYADMALAEEAINEGKVSCYISKPWDNKKLIVQLNTLIKELQVERKQRSALKQLNDKKKKLASAEHNISLLHEHADQQQSDLKVMNNELIHVGAHLISYFCQEHDHQSERVAQQAKLLALRLGQTFGVAQQIYLAGLYHKIGSFGVPQDLLHKGWQQMTDNQKARFVKLSVNSTNLLRGSQLLAPSAEILAHLYEHVDGTGFPDGLFNDEISIGSKILSVVLYYDLLVRGDFVQEPIAHGEAKIMMTKLSGQVFDRQIIKQFFQLIESPTADEYFERVITVGQLRQGMVLSQDLLDENERKLLVKGTHVSAKCIAKLETFEQSSKQHLRVYITWGKSAGEVNVDTK